MENDHSCFSFMVDTEFQSDVCKKLTWFTPTLKTHSQLSQNYHLQEIKKTFTIHGP